MISFLQNPFSCLLSCYYHTIYKFNTGKFTRIRIKIFNKKGISLSNNFHIQFNLSKIREKIEGDFFLFIHKMESF